MTNLLAYHNDPEIKAAIMAQLQAHYGSDEIVKGQYWKNGKGCAVGCTIHSGDHVEYEGRFGIPIMLARLEDCIFEGLPNGAAKEWPLWFMNAIEPGADLSRVGWKFLYWLLTDEKVNPGISHPSVSEAVKQCAEVLKPLTEGEQADENLARSAASAAWNAARSAARRAARSAARSAAWCAGSAENAAESAWDAAENAWDAACSAENAAESAAQSAWDAACSAENAAENAARSAARRAARSAAYVRMADKLVELIVGAR